MVSAWERGFTTTYLFDQGWSSKSVGYEKRKALVKLIEQCFNEAYKPHIFEPIRPDRSQERPVDETKYSVSSLLADFVLRGIQACEEIAKQQLGNDHRWQAIQREIPAEELGPDFLITLVTRRLHRMFRSLASAARDDGFSYRMLSNGASWAIDVQYDLIDRFPVRPDETSEFLRALLIDVFNGARAGRRITGRWGEVQIAGKNELILSIVPPSSSRDEAVTPPSTVHFTRVRR
jgi:hypothetical protein